MSKQYYKIIPLRTKKKSMFDTIQEVANIIGYPFNTVMKELGYVKKGDVIEFFNYCIDHKYSADRIITAHLNDILIACNADARILCLDNVNKERKAI